MLTIEQAIIKIFGPLPRLARDADADKPDSWITTENGTHVPIKNGALAGKVGRKIEESKSGKAGGEASISITGNELGSYADAKELRQKAVQYYKDNLQKNPAHRADIGKIRFSGKGMDETKSFSADPDKLLMLPALRNIIETGTLGKEEKLKHPRRDGIVAFIPITKRVDFKGKPKEVEALIGKDRNGNLYYDLFLDGKRQKESPASGVGHNPRLSGDSKPGVNPVAELNVNIFFPRVNPDNIAYDRAYLAEVTLALRAYFKKYPDPPYKQPSGSLAEILNVNIKETGGY
jgi:hypothetical protein